MVITVKGIVKGADTADQGHLVLERLRHALKTGDVVVSFDGIQTATSSFVNTAFIPLLQDFSIRDIKRKMRVVKSTRQINEMIKTRLEREALVSA